jgi:hypothetical protein
MKDPKHSIFLANIQMEKLHTRQTDGLMGKSGTNSMPLSAAKMKQDISQNLHFSLIRNNYD